MKVFDLDTLAPGQEIAGPAIVESAMTTVLLRDGDVARTNETAGSTFQCRFVQLEMTCSPDSRTSARRPTIREPVYALIIWLGTHAAACGAHESYVIRDPNLHLRESET